MDKFKLDLIRSLYTLHKATLKDEPLNMLITFFDEEKGCLRNILGEVDGFYDKYIMLMHSNYIILDIKLQVILSNEEIYSYEENPLAKQGIDIAEISSINIII